MRFKGLGFRVSEYQKADGRRGCSRASSAFSNLGKIKGSVSIGFQASKDKPTTAGQDSTPTSLCSKQLLGRHRATHEKVNCQIAVRSLTKACEHAYYCRNPICILNLKSQSKPMLNKFKISLGFRQQCFWGLSTFP